MKLKRIIQMLNEGCSLNEIAAQTSSSKTTVAGYKKASLATGLSYEELLKLEDAELVRLLQPPSPTPNVDPRRAKLEEMMPEICKRMAKRHATIQLVHQEYYLKECPDGYKYTQFKKYVKEYRERHDYSYHNTYEPGREWQIDFAGDALWLTDRKTGERQKLAVLVCVMPYSNLPFMMALPKASQYLRHHPQQLLLAGVGGACRRTGAEDGLKLAVGKPYKLAEALACVGRLLLQARHRALAALHLSAYGTLGDTFQQQSQNLFLSLHNLAFLTVCKCV